MKPFLALIAPHTGSAHEPFLATVTPVEAHGPIDPGYGRPGGGGPVDPGYGNPGGNPIDPGFGAGKPPVDPDYGSGRPLPTVEGHGWAYAYVANHGWAWVYVPKDRPPGIDNTLPGGITVGTPPRPDNTLPPQPAPAPKK